MQVFQTVCLFPLPQTACRHFETLLECMWMTKPSDLTEVSEASQEMSWKLES